MRYLSTDWIGAADQAVKNASASAPAQTVIIDQHVRGGVNYRVTVGPAPSLHAFDEPEAPPADATFSQTLETATAVAQGTTDAHQAFLLGHIRFEGNINVLIEQRDAFDWLQNALAPVLAETTFDENAT